MFRYRLDKRVLFHSNWVGKRRREYGRSEDIFSQGDAGDTVMYIQSGGVKMSVRSKMGREVIVAMLGPGDFFGEGCMAGQPRRAGTATAVTVSSIVVLKKKDLLRLIREQRPVAAGFIAHLIDAHIRIEGDLVGQFFNHDEKRLARTLLVLARYGEDEAPDSLLPRVTQAALAKMTGTSRSRVGFFMKKFERLGFVDTGRGITVNSSLLSVVLHE